MTDLADFARIIGGDHVRVSSMTKGDENPHEVPLSPKFVPPMMKADLVVLVGLNCEYTFLPALLEASKNASIQEGRPGYVDCSRGIAIREVFMTDE